ncbi:MAG: MptD family putative ECF transporter S component [Eubacteriales bacterium]|nr:MptD family putative ECF transporter S component [Eubacteriales bacterium]
MDKKLTVKDFVNIGVFAVVYFVVIFAVGMMGVVPILFLVYPTIGGIVAGTVVMLFMAKTAKPWAFLIFGMLTPILMFIMGHTYLLPLGSLAVTLIAELVRRSGGYRSLAKERIACAIFNCWVCFSHMQMLLLHDKYMELVNMMGENYGPKLERLITWPNMALVALGALVGGYIGAIIGSKLLKKHFQKAGIA